MRLGVKVGVVLAISLTQFLGGCSLLFRGHRIDKLRKRAAHDLDCPSKSL